MSAAIVGIDSALVRFAFLERFAARLPCHLHAGDSTGWFRGSSNLDQFVRITHSNTLARFCATEVAGTPQHKLGRDDITASRWVWCDLTRTDELERSRAANPTEWRSHSLDQLRGCRVPPTVIIDDGTGYFALWKLDKLCTDIDRIETINRWLQQELRIRGEHWRITDTAPLPGSLECRLVEWHQEREYSSDEFGTAVAAALKDSDRNHQDLLSEMNSKHCVLVQEASVCRVLSWERSELDSSRESPVLQGIADFKNRYLHRTVAVTGERGGVRLEQLGKWWLHHPKRREYLGLRFTPGGDEPGYLNLWRGFGVASTPGTWNLLHEHIEHVLAGGEPAYAEYIIRWLAWSVQHPAQPAEVALVFRGARGTGKSMFCRCVMRLFGQHAISVTSPAQLTGRFNQHLRDCVALFADEAIAASDKAAESVLKALITEHELAIEGKGVNVVMARNRLHILMASNEAWCVPAGIDERRFAVFEVSSKRAQDHEYFARLTAEIDGGGLSAMLFDLLAMDLGKWHPRKGVPQTDALGEQKARSLRGPESYVRAMLESGDAHGCIKVEGERVFVSTSAAYKAFGLATRDATAVGRALGKASVDGRSSRAVDEAGTQHRGYWLPSLREARARWSAAMGGPKRWPTDDNHWLQVDPSQVESGPEERHF